MEDTDPPNPGPAMPAANPGGELAIRAFRPGDETAIMASFNAVFAVAGRPPRRLAEWRWAFAANPVGMRVFVAMEGARCVAHYASQPRRTLLDGRAVTFAQIVDAFVLPEYRRRETGGDVFARLGDAMLVRTVGVGRDVIAYGWPTMHHLQVGARRLGYLIVRQDEGLSREPGSGSRELPAAVFELFQYDDRIERLYDRCAIEWGASTIRDRAYLQWRVFDCPLRRYRVLATTAGGGELSGCAIVAVADWPRSRSLQVVDWLVPRGNVDSGSRLLDAVLALGRAEGVATVLAMFPPWSPWYAHFRNRGFHAGKSGYAMVSGNYNDPRYSPEWLRDRWWYQPLDLDLF